MKNPWSTMRMLVPQQGKFVFGSCESIFFRLCLDNLSVNFGILGGSNGEDGRVWADSRGDAVSSGDDSLHSEDSKNS